MNNDMPTAKDVYVKPFSECDITDGLIEYSFTTEPTEGYLHYRLVEQPLDPLAQGIQNFLDLKKNGAYGNYE